ncbi:unnamed protein product [Staurois parvus]|uniref:Uncharacterized protein n=1 Tax=Staurois parvus TaxID=386267 RepID=A0ABN9AC12_9NEOB|nr:unnamed protein product [Staurois parvus]
MIPYCPGGPMSCQSAPEQVLFYIGVDLLIMDCALCKYSCMCFPHSIMPLVPYS